MRSHTPKKKIRMRRATILSDRISGRDNEVSGLATRFTSERNRRERTKREFVLNSHSHTRMHLHKFFFN